MAEINFNNFQSSADERVNQTSAVKGFDLESITSMAANATRVLQRTGNKIAVYAGQGLTIRMSPSGQQITLDAGVVVQVQPFDRVEIINGSTIQDVQVYTGSGDYFDGRSNISATISATLAPATTFAAEADAAIAGGASVNISAADTDKRQVFISNPETNTMTFRIGDSTVDATKGFILEPGGSMIIDTSAAIYAHNTGATSETLGVSRSGV